MISSPSRELQSEPKPPRPGWLQPPRSIGTGLGAGTGSPFASCHPFGPGFIHPHEPRGCSRTGQGLKAPTPS